MEHSPLKPDHGNKHIQIEMIDSESPLRQSRLSNFQKLEVNILDEMKNDQEEEFDVEGTHFKEDDIETERNNTVVEVDNSGVRQKEISISDIKSCEEESSIGTPRTNGRELRTNRDLLTEIITRKDGGRKGGASHKAHMSYYHHMRRMKKRNLTMAVDTQLGLGSSFREKEEGPVYNDDLDCVMGDPSAKSVAGAPEKRWRKVSAKVRGDGLNRNHSKNKLQSERAKFGAVKKEFRSAFDVGLGLTDALEKRKTLGPANSNFSSKSSLMSARNDNDYNHPIGSGLALIKEQNSIISSLGRRKSLPESPSKLHQNLANSDIDMNEELIEEESILRETEDNNDLLISQSD